MRKAMAATTMKTPATNRPLAPQPAAITEYGDFVRALVDRRHSLGMSQMDLDARAGFAEAHTGKLENFDKRWGRWTGFRSLSLWLGALECGIVLVDLKTGKPIATDDQGKPAISLVRDAG